SGIAGTNPMKTSVESFKIALAAFIVPFMLFYSPELLLLSDSNISSIFAAVTALLGVYFLAAAVQGWFYKRIAPCHVRIILFAVAIVLMTAAVFTDLTALALIGAVIIIQIFDGSNSKARKIQPSVEIE